MRRQRLDWQYPCYNGSYGKTLAETSKSVNFGRIDGIAVFTSALAVQPEMAATEATGRG